MDDPLPALKALADPVRLQIVAFLAEPVPSCCSRGDGVCACDFEELLGLSQPTVSHHMRQLVDAGLVASEKRGRWVYYDLVPQAFERLGAGIAALPTGAGSGARPAAGTRASQAVGPRGRDRGARRATARSAER